MPPSRCWIERRLLSTATTPGATAALSIGATEAQTPNVALFFLATAKPDLLKDAPGGAAYLAASPDELNRGKVVFAERCARCHSSKQPPPGDQPSQTDWFRKAVTQDDFLTNNFLSDDQRYPAGVDRVERVCALDRSAGVRGADDHPAGRSAPA